MKTTITIVTQRRMLGREMSNHLYGVYVSEAAARERIKEEHSSLSGFSFNNYEIDKEAEFPILPA